MNCNTTHYRANSSSVPGDPTAALALTREYEPDAITLDINLPDIDGWRVLERLKYDLATRHIPVYVVSTDDSRERALVSGALAFVAKPVQSRDLLDSLVSNVIKISSERERRVLVVEPDEERRTRLIENLSADDVLMFSASDVEEAGSIIRDQAPDCVVIHSDLPQLEKLAVYAREVSDGLCTRVPIIVHSNGEPDPDTAPWRKLTQNCTVHRTHSEDRLQDLVAFVLHRNITQLPESRQRMLRDLHYSDRVLDGKKVLIVDDDMRNIFALSTLLEEHNMVIVSADNGRDAITILQNDDQVQIVLMDIMMPEMDGMETMRAIRRIPKLQNLPIVALTAKAMKGDREKCIEAGAWDYLSKPVDTERMFSVLRAWLHR